MKKFHLPCFTLCLLASACGGGSDDTLVLAPPPSLASINTNNVQTIAGASYASVTNAVTNAEFTATFLVSAVQQITTINQPPPATISCPANGSVSLTGQLNALGSIGSGDSLTLSFTNCVGDGVTVNGSYQVSVSAFAGNISGTYTLTGVATLSDLAITRGQQSGSTNGDVSVAIDTTIVGRILTSFTGTSITASLNQSTTLEGFSFNSELLTSMVPNGFSIEGAAGLRSPSFDCVTISTVMPLTGVVGQFASSGEMIVTATDNSSVRVIALDNLNVRLELDEDGDGAVDETRDVPWGTLGN